MVTHPFRYLVSLLFGLLPLLGQAQSIYTLAFLADKVGSPFTVQQGSQFLSTRSIARRAKFGISITERDLPVSATYLQQMRQAGLSLGTPSKWLNAVPVYGDSATVTKALQGFAFIKNYKYVTEEGGSNQSRYGCKDGIASAEGAPDYGQASQQVKMLGIDKMHADGVTGKGVLVAILDGGFLNVDQHTAFDRIRSNQGFVDVKNLLEDVQASPYALDVHGGYVLSCVGGYYPGNFVAGAYDAKYLLYVTEDVPRERPIETFWWALGAERADSAGADIINSSLGYTTFDKIWQSLSLDNIDGQTALCTQAANFAAQVGIVVVSSAGNEGNSFSWQGHISAPGDAPLAITVGALSPDSQYVGFSSRGFGKRGYLKPDVVTQGTQVFGYSPNNPLGVSGNLAGTSFSSPLTAGLLAGMMQRFPQAPPSVWQEALHATSSRTARPDTVFGYGIPNYQRLNDYLTKKYGVLATRLVLHPNPSRVNGDLQIDIPPGYSGQPVPILNMLGQTVKQSSLQKISDTGWQLSLAGLAPGTYFLRILTPNRAYTSRILIAD